MDIESGFISDESVANRKFFEQVWNCCCCWRLDWGTYHTLPHLYR